MHKPLIYNLQHDCHPLIASCASAERTHYCGVGSTSKRCVSIQLFSRTGQTRGNGVVGEWSDKAVGSLGGVWGALGYTMDLLFSPAKKFHNLLSSSISTTRWRDNQGKCVLAYNSHILCRTFKNLISRRSLNCAESRHYRPRLFPLIAFFRKFAKCCKPTFSYSSQAILPFSTKLFSQHLWTLVTKSY